MSQSIWGIAAFFNPQHYCRHALNYRRFRRHLGIPLVTVELGYDDRFELDESDAELLIQLPARDVLWQRERLFNLALAAVPEGVDKVACLDTDVIFERADWPVTASRLLDEYPLVQLFSEFLRQPRDLLPESPGFPAPGPGRPSLASLVGPGCDLREVCLHAPRLPGMTLPGPSGLAWAFRRELLSRHGVYDRCVLGGGDICLVAAVAGCYEIAERNQHMSVAARDHYLAWAEPLNAEADRRVGCVPGRLFHLWHGDLKHRGYATRYAGLARFAFDPATDLRLDAHGVWQWASDKPEMHAYVRDYFASRQEDGAAEAP